MLDASIEPAEEELDDGYTLETSDALVEEYTLELSCEEDVSDTETEETV